MSKSISLPDDMVFVVSKFYIRGLHEAVLFSLVCKQFKLVLLEFNVWKWIFELRFGKKYEGEIDQSEREGEFYRKEYLREMEFDKNYDPNRVFGNAPETSLNNDTELGKLIIQHIERGQSWLDCVDGSYKKLSDVPCWFRKVNEHGDFEFIFAFREYFQYEIFTKLFIKTKLALFPCSVDSFHPDGDRSDNKTSLDLFLEFGSSVSYECVLEPEKEKKEDGTENDEDENRKFPEPIDITKGKRLDFGKLLHQKYLHFALERTLSDKDTDFFERALLFLLNIELPSTEVTNRVYSTKKVLEIRNRVRRGEYKKKEIPVEKTGKEKKAKKRGFFSFGFGKKKKKKKKEEEVDVVPPPAAVVDEEKEEHLTFEEMISFVLKEDEIVENGRQTEKDPRYSKDHFEPRNDRGETEEEEKSTYNKRGSLEVTKFVSTKIEMEELFYMDNKEKFWETRVDEKNKVPEEVIEFSGEAIVYRKIDDSGFCGHRNDDIYLARLVVTNHRLFIQLKRMMRFQEEGIAYS